MSAFRTAGAILRVRLMNHTGKLFFSAGTAGMVTVCISPPCRRARESESRQRPCHPAPPCPAESELLLFPLRFQCLADRIFDSSKNHVTYSGPFLPRGEAWTGPIRGAAWTSAG